MPQISYIGANFSKPFTKFNKSASLTFSWPELVWAAVTVGKAAGDEYAYGIYSAQERLHRATIIRAYLRTSKKTVVQTKVYEMSDPSEKTSISFYLGMTLAKLFSEKLFGVPKLLHFAVYKDDYVTKTKAGKSRPDLIGKDQKGKWFVFEAKGRSNNFDDVALEKAKEQAQQIVTINMVKPLCRIGGQAYFDDNLSFRMVDPDHEESKFSRRLSFDEKALERLYYEPLEAIADGRGRRASISVEGNWLSEVSIPELDLWIAIPDRDESAKHPGTSRKLLPMEYLGGDGVLVRLGESWSEKNMELEPHQRS